MIHPILRMGDPRLLRVAHPVPAAQLGTPELHDFIEDMFETMHAVNGAGLAAPQIGINLRIVIFGFEQLARYPEAEAVPATVLINPTITPLSDDMEGGWEGCLSVPGMRGWVERHGYIRYGGFDEKGNRFTRTVNGFHARVVQHECDHLDGKLYPMRITDMSKFGFTDVLFPDGSVASDE
jgi:peptide deformylase